MSWKPGKLLVVAVATLLVAAQMLVTVHSYEHEPGYSPGQLCAGCVAAAQLSAASIDNAPAEIPSIPHGNVTCFANYGWISAERPCVRQRGPPAPLLT
jgi:hypothetical protein